MRSRWAITSTVLNFPSEASSRQGEAHRRHGHGCRLPRGSMGWVGGGYPSALLKARTAASDGQRVFTRASRSAGLRFAVILLSKAMDIGRDHLIHRKRSPFPYEGKALTRSKFGVTFPAGSGTSNVRRAKRCRTGDAHFPSRSGLKPSPCRRRGTASRWMRSRRTRMPDITNRAPEAGTNSTLHSSLSTLFFGEGGPLRGG